MPRCSVCGKLSKYAMVWIDKKNVCVECDEKK